MNIIINRVKLTFHSMLFRSLRLRLLPLVSILMTATVLNCANIKQLDSILIYYHKSGGFAGVNDSLTIYKNGNVHFTQKAQRREFKMDSLRMGNLHQVLNNIDFQGLRSEYLASRRARDLFEHEIIYGQYNIRMQDTAIPESLESLVTLLNQIVQKE